MSSTSKVWWFGIVHTLALSTITLWTAWLACWARLPEILELVHTRGPTWFAMAKVRTTNWRRAITSRLQLLLSIELPPLWMSQRRYLKKTR